MDTIIKGQERQFSDSPPSMPPTLRSTLTPMQSPSPSSDLQTPRSSAAPKMTNSQLPTSISSPHAAPDEVLIRVEGVGKRFCKDLKRSLFYGVQDISRDLTGRSLAGRPLRKREFWANQDISFELRRGECLGLIGRNGAGKTTLLKMLNGLMKPDEGRIEIKGRIGALIALGAGFNPILTGRENVFVAGSVYGLSKKEINDKYDEIVAFAEMGEFMESPVQNYSSGMKVRLGFAVASAFKPDVLLVDEVLAVGDFAFRQKCLTRLTELLTQAAVIFVSHNFDQIERVCTKGILLERGREIAHDTIPKIKNIYDELVGDKDRNYWADSRISVVDQGPRLILSDDQVTVNLRLSLTEPISDICLRVRFRGADGQYIGEYHSLNHGPSFDLAKGEQLIQQKIDLPRLKTGEYRADLFLNRKENEMLKFLEIKPFTTMKIDGYQYGFDNIQL